MANRKSFDQNETNRRHPYKQWLQHSSISVPISTVRRKLIKRSPLMNDNPANSSMYYSQKPMTSIEGHQLRSSYENTQKTKQKQSPEAHIEAAELTDDILTENESEIDDHDLAKNETDKIAGKSEEMSENELLIMAFALRHQLSDSGIQDLLLLIDVLMPKREIPISAHIFFKKFNYKAMEVRQKYFCDDCKVTLSAVNPDKEKFLCSDCSTVYSKSELLSKNHFFYYIPVSNALKKFINSEDYITMINRNGFSDVNNGTYYHQLANKCHPPLIKKTDVTLQFNTDGVSTFRSSKYSLWPIQLMINNLPQKLKRKYQLLCGLWFGPGKPDIDMYFEMFIEEMNLLNEEGLIRHVCSGPNKSPIRIRFHVLVGVVDSVARPLLQNISQFNGIFGCTYCLKRGILVAGPKGGRTRVYVGKEIPTLRSMTQHLRDAEMVLKMLSSKQKKSVVIHGVKGPSTLSSLNNFDITCCFSPDYMHSVLLGVTKTFVQAWFDSKNHESAWYLGKKVTQIDEKIAEIRPPIEITRPPRSINTTSDWKASEWKNFLIYYSYFLLCDVGWSSTYIVHWSSLIYAIYVYLKPQITDIEFQNAKKSLHYFVESVPRLYNESFCKFNVHLLLHIPDWVKKFGGLWASSGFPYEDFNGVLNGLFSNVTGIQQQICKRYFRWKKTKEIGSSIFPSNADDGECSEKQKLYNHLFQNHFRQYTTDTGESHISQRKKEVLLSLGIKTEIEQTLGSKIKSHSVYHCFGNFDGMVCHSSNYSALQKRNNSYIQLKGRSTFAYIKNIIMVQKLEGSDCPIIVMEAEKLETMVCQKPNFNKYVKSVYHIGKHSGCTIIITADCIQNKCIGLVRSEQPDETVILIPLVNYFEKGW